MNGVVTVDFKDGVLSVTLNRPEKRNALSRAVIAESLPPSPPAADGTT